MCPTCKLKEVTSANLELFLRCISHPLKKTKNYCQNKKLIVKTKKLLSKKNIIKTKNIILSIKYTFECVPHIDQQLSTEMSFPVQMDQQFTLLHHSKILEA